MPAIARIPAFITLYTLPACSTLYDFDQFRFGRGDGALLEFAPNASDTPPSDARVPTAQEASIAELPPDAPSDLAVVPADAPTEGVGARHATLVDTPSEPSTIMADAPGPSAEVGDAASDGCVPPCSFGYRCLAGACVTDTTLQPFGYCQRESDYVRSAVPLTVRLSGAQGAAQFAPRCLRVRAGTSIAFAMDFTNHVLRDARGHGTQPSPIRPTVAATTEVAYVFTVPGFYPYLCRDHGSLDGGGEAGVVWVE